MPGFPAALNTSRAAFPDWHFHPDVWAIVLLLAGGYAFALRRHRRSGEAPARPLQIVAFAAGVGAVLVASEWPVHDLAEHYLYSAHMVQHLLLSLVFPPLLLVATPPWLARWLLWSWRPAWAVVRRLARPLPAFILFNGFVIATHWPPAVELAVQSEPAHLAIHVGLVTTAVLMWMPVLSPLPELPRLSAPAQMLYLFAQSILPTVPASWLTWADQPVYAIYETLPKLWGVSAVDDQRVAGLVMKVVGGFVLWGFIAVVFFRWALREERTDRQLLWSDVETELNQLGPGPTPPTAH